MSYTAQGDPVKGEVVSTDAHAGVAVTFYPGSSLTARVPLATEYVLITDVIFISTAGGTYNLVFYPIGGAIADGAGLRIVKGNAEVLGGVAHHFETPIEGPRGYGVALIAAVGQVDLVVAGNICKG